MARPVRQLIYVAGCAVVCAGLASAQRGGSSWNTAGGDAQRSASLATDPSVSVASMQKPGFAFLWKAKATNDARAGHAMSEAITVSSYIGYRGFRSYAFLTGASNELIGFDTDLGRIEWERHFDIPNPPAGNAACPGGMTSAPSRSTPFALAEPGGRGVVAAGRGNGAASAVGKAGEGAVQVGAVAGGGRGGRGAAGGSGRGGGGNRGAFGSNEMIALTSDGMLRPVLIGNGVDQQAPIRFLPANANASGLIFTENDAFVSTSGGCGGVPNGVWQMSLTGADKTVNTWKTNGGGVVGTAFSGDGTVFAATGDGDYSPTSYSDSIVSLDPKGLKLKDFFTPAKSEFTTGPVIFAWKDKQLVAAANRDGRLYLLDTASLGGADHKTPLAVSGVFGNVNSGALSTYDDGTTRWIIAPVSGAINGGTKFPGMNGSVTAGTVVAFRVVDQSGKPSLEPAWASRDLVVPNSPIVVNGVVLAVSGGDAQHGAVLYALDGSSGKDLWNSGNTITGQVRSGVSGSASQFYLSTLDSTVYAFGFGLVK